MVGQEETRSSRLMIFTYFEKLFWFRQTYKKKPENFLRISVLVSKKRSNKKRYVLYSTKYPLIIGISLPDKSDIRLQIDRMSHILWYLSECRFKRVGQFCVSSATFHKNQLYMALTAQDPN